MNNAARTVPQSVEGYGKLLNVSLQRPNLLGGKGIGCLQAGPDRGNAVVDRGERPLGPAHAKAPATQTCKGLR